MQPTVSVKNSSLTDTQLGLLTIPAVTVLTLAVLILLNKTSRKNPLAYISLFLAGIHLYHHYTLIGLQNKH
jgi:sugar phosphate permease